MNPLTEKKTNIICISGTPGTGKTTLAKKICTELKYKYIDGNSIIKKYDLSEKFDSKNKCKIVDVVKFSKAVIKECKNLEENKKKEITFVIDSHLSHHIPSEKTKLCIICKCNLKNLSNRLKKRNYSAQKIKDNLEAEIFETCHIEAQEKKHKIIIYQNNYKQILTRLKKLN